LEVKNIYIDTEKSIGDWVENNHLEIMGVLYANIFDFSKGREPHRVVLRVITNPDLGNFNRVVFAGISYEFMLIRDDIIHTIDTLIANFEELEDYEKCYELLQLKNEM
jgi:hypothetical protein